MASDIRSLSHQLHSSKLHYVGLVPYGPWPSGKIKKPYGIEIRFSERGISTSLSKDVALSLFRISQEALSNIVKHSDARSGRISMPTQTALRFRSLTKAKDLTRMLDTPTRESASPECVKGSGLSAENFQSPRTYERHDDFSWKFLWSLRE